MRSSFFLSFFLFNVPLIDSSSLYLFSLWYSDLEPFPRVRRTFVFRHNTTFICSDKSLWWQWIKYRSEHTLMMIFVDRSISSGGGGLLSTLSRLFKAQMFGSEIHTPCRPPKSQPLSLLNPLKRSYERWGCSYDNN